MAQEKEHQRSAEQTNLNQIITQMYLPKWLGGEPSDETIRKAATAGWRPDGPITYESMVVRSLWL